MYNKRERNDLLVITELSCIARSLAHLLEIIEELKTCQIRFKLYVKISPHQQQVRPFSL
ncbi:MAG: recombinase family protein [Rickettsiales endosymbiont of Dermacentor nuttalli]